MLTVLGMNACSSDPRTFDTNSKYYFDGFISRQVLENYLDRSVTAGYFLVPGTPENYLFPFREDENRPQRTSSNVCDKNDYTSGK